MRYTLDRRKRRYAMSYELLLLFLGAATIAIVFRATDPFRISAMKRAMRSGDAKTLLRALDHPVRQRRHSAAVPARTEGHITSSKAGGLK